MIDTYGEQPATETRALMQEYFAGGGYSLRWLLYRFTDDGLDFHTEARELLGLRGSESVLDIGCGQAGFLDSIGAIGHDGLLTGLDINEALGSAALKSSVTLLRADANNNLPFADESFDTVTELFMVYHAESQLDLLAETARVMKKTGRAVIATTGPGHKLQHRAFEALISEELGIAKPPAYAENFDTDAADVLLPMVFEVVVALDQRTTITISEKDFSDGKIPPGGKVEAYAHSLKSMACHYNPPQPARRLNEPIENLVLPEIKRQIKDKGKFVEPIHRRLYVCSRPRQDFRRSIVDGCQ